MMLSVSVASLLFLSSSCLAAAVFTEDPQNTTVLLGEQAIFSCSFENIDSLPSWTATDGGTFTGSNTDGDVRYIQVSNTRVSLNVTATLTRDGVCYFCITNLITGRIQSARGCLTLAAAAEFTEDPQNTTVLLGEQAIFSCSFENISSFPSWTATDGGTFTASDTDGDVRYIQVSNTRVSLNVTATLARDGVCYFCITNLITGPIQSALGCLTLAEPPDSPMVNQADATLSTVTVSWTVPSSNVLYPVTGYEVLFNEAITMLASSITSYEITGLTSGTSYIVNVRARNAAGLGEYGTVMASTMAPPDIIPLIIGVVVAVVTVTLLSLLILVACIHHCHCTGLHKENPAY